MKQTRDYQVIVIGAGHAGVEAALASARMDLDVLVITTNIGRIGYMSCNPSIGGLAKGHMVRELDALGGEMGVAADETCIQFKRLNARKGPAVRGSRSQCDKDLYSQYMGQVLGNHSKIRILESEVKSLVLENNRCCGVRLADGSSIGAEAVIVTTGTFMRGIMFVGDKREEGGRVGDRGTVGLSDQLASLGFSVRRLKTGTPPRLEKDSIDWSQLQAQYGDERFIPFSFRSSGQLKLPQVACYISYTGEQTHEIIRKNLDRSPLFCGQIEGTGPRYCPSIEDKITRFADKERHQTFLEPEGLNTNLIYLQGISTSLPEDVQDRFLRTIPGLENVRVVRYGYAVEYDFIEPTQIRHTLETKEIEGLFLAGQINGTSGYEEAAVQGLVAGVNASLRVLGRDPFILRRDEAYIGVLIDDLVIKGTKEPYRMFTSRAEHRLVLREDNVLERLMHKGIELGLVSGAAKKRGADIVARREKLRKHLVETQLVPDEETQERLKQLGTPLLLKPCRLGDLLKRPNISLRELKAFGVEEDSFEVGEPVEIEIKYEGYIKRQLEVIEQTTRLERMEIPADICFQEIRGLRSEEVEKLTSIQPTTLGQASRISGVNPSAIQALLMYIKGRARRELKL